MRISEIYLLILLACLSGCSGGSSSTLPSAAPSGAYEFVVTSNVTGSTTLVEAELSGKGNQSSASGPSQVQIITFENKLVYINGVCAGSTPGQNSVDANITKTNTVAVTFNDGGNATVAQGSLTGTTVSGSYTVNGSSCPDLVGHLGFPNGYDSGGFTGNPVPKLTGSFVGVLNLHEGVENVQITLQESNDQTLTVQAALSGSAETGNFTFSGPAIGNVMLISGSVNGNTETWFGLVDPLGRFSGVGNSIVVFDYETLTKAGVLLQQ